AQSGDLQRGTELMRDANAAAHSNTARHRRTLYLGHMAAAEADLGQPEVGLNLLDEAMQLADKTEERFFEAELHRLRGHILLALGREGEAEAELLKALTIARQQQARWWELRAVTSLAKHWHNQRKYMQAYSLLQPAYAWFTEGFQTPSLKNA